MKVIYKGILIIQTCGFYFALGQCFKTIKQAKQEIDTL